jgi:hypothetical protein
MSERGHSHSRCRCHLYPSISAIAACEMLLQRNVGVGVGVFVLIVIGLDIHPTNTDITTRSNAESGMQDRTLTRTWENPSRDLGMVVVGWTCDTDMTC